MSLKIHKKLFEEKLRKDISEEVLLAIKRVVPENAKVYLFGGAMRGLYYGSKPRDFDFKVLFSAKDFKQGVKKIEKNLSIKNKDFVKANLGDVVVIRFFDEGLKSSVDLGIHLISQNFFKSYFQKRRFLSTPIVLNSVFFDVNNGVFFDRNNAFQDLIQGKIRVLEGREKDDQPFFVAVRAIYFLSRHERYILEEKSSVFLKSAFKIKSKNKNFWKAFLTERNEISFKALFEDIFGGLSFLPERYWVFAFEFGLLDSLQELIQEELSVSKRQILEPKWGKSFQENFKKFTFVLANEDKNKAKKVFKFLRAQEFFY